MLLCARQKYFAKLIARIGFSNYCGANGLESFLTGRRAYKTLRLVESKVNFEFDWVETGNRAKHETFRIRLQAYALVLTEKTENQRYHRNLALSVTLPP